MISVILPTYNHAPYLRQRIDSILNQTWQDFELIILDDCSPDNSRDIIESYRENPHISHIVYNETNSGSTFRQWKKGIELAKGDYIWIAESDDYADVTFLEKVMSSIQRYNSVYSFAKTTIVDKDNKTVKEQPSLFEGNSMSLNEFVKNYLLFSNPVSNASMVVFRKDAVAQFVWDSITDFKYCGDWLLWACFTGDEQATVSEVKEYLNFFRTHSVNVSNKSELNGLGMIEGFKISEIITKRLNIKRNKEFALKWYYKWQEHKVKFSYSSSLNKKILTMFIKKQPWTAYYELKRLIFKK